MQPCFGGDADPKFWAGMVWKTAICRQWFNVGELHEWQEYCGLGAIKLKVEADRSSKRSQNEHAAHSKYTENVERNTVLNGFRMFS